MSSDKPVVVYGASGYTGRLICEYLREFHVPFIAAGRDKAKIAEALDRVPGIDTVPHEIIEVDHQAGPLTELFDGAKVVCNTVGPFAQYGGEVVEACIAAGAHYLDTTGEQDWLITCDETYGPAMAEKGQLLAPGIAQMYTTGEIAAELCLENPGLDTLDILVFWKGFPTIASTKTILVNAALAKAYYLEQNTYEEWPADGGLYGVTIPGQHETGLALPWGGTSHPVWFKRDPRVANVKVLGGVFNRPLMLGVPQIVLINVLLSGDTAVVIAMACRGLAPRQRLLGVAIGSGTAAVLLHKNLDGVDQLVGGGGAGGDTDGAREVVGELVG